VFALVNAKSTLLPGMFYEHNGLHILAIVLFAIHLFNRESVGEWYPLLPRNAIQLSNPVEISIF